MNTTLTELQAMKLGHISIEDFGIKIKPADEENPESVARTELVLDTLEKYFDQFTLPIIVQLTHEFMGRLRCISCMSAIDGALSVLSKSITGEHLICNACKYPYRLVHNPIASDDSQIFNKPISLLLPWHPDYLKETEDGYEILELSDVGRNESSARDSDDS